jgi:hypothetical protein
LRDNYKEEDLVAFGWVGLGIFFIGARVWYGLMNWGIWEGVPLEWLYFWKLDGSDFVGGYVSLVLLSWVVAQDRGWKLWQFLEDVTQIFLVWLMTILMPMVWQTRSTEILARLIALMLIFILGFWVKGKYRSWFWYKSGKKGLWFFLANLIYWLMNSLIIFWWGGGIQWTMIVSGIFCLLSMVGLFILGGVYEKK